MMLLFGIMMGGSHIPYLGPMFLFVAICFSGRYTGGCFNGAIALAVYVFNISNFAKNLPTLILTNLVELAGSLTGIFLAFTFLGTSISYVSPGDNASPLMVIYIETVASFFMISFVMYCKTAELAASKDGMIMAFFICLFIFATASMAGPVSGGCVNPFTCAS